MRMGLREANQRFSRAIKAVKAGREVILTERGKAIAVIKPFRTPTNADAVIETMIAEGRLRPAATPRPLPRRRWRPIRIAGGPLSRTLRADRDAR
jgi:antitoxin (DNA-binding transcriptional repressor) of toxin-antitoxin stability system